MGEVSHYFNRYAVFFFLVENLAMNTPPKTAPKNPLHGITLEALVTELVARYGWEGLAQRVDIRCFKNDPSIKSSLTFLRKTPWAREKVEALFVRSSASRSAVKTP